MYGPGGSMVTSETESRAALERARRVSGGVQLARIAGRFPDKTGFIYLGRNYSFAEVDAQVDRVARGLASTGVTKGDRVAMLMGNSMATIEAYFALSRLGAIAVPVNLRLAVKQTKLS